LAEASVEQLRNSPVYFADKVLGVTLHEGQKRILKCEDRFICVRAARRFGKSFVFATYAAWAAVTNPNHRVVCVAKTQRQSAEMFNTIYRLISSSVISNSITRSTLTRIELSNGSIIESLPGSSYESLRGLTINLILVDESAYVPEDLFIVLYPTLLTTQGTIVLISTPGVAAGEFYRACQPDSEYVNFHMTHDDAVFADGTHLVPPEELEREKIRCGGEESPQWIREYLAEFTQAEGAWFNKYAIDDAFSFDPEQLEFAIPGRKYAMAADLAKEQDYTVIIVIDYTDPTYVQIVHHRRFNGKETDELMRELYDVAMRFDIKMPHIDSTGMGNPIMSHLKTKYPNLNWIGQNFSNTSKLDMMTDLDILLNRRQLGIPADEQIRKELASFQYSKSQTGTIKMKGEGTHDDYPIAIALAVKAANVVKQRGGVTIGTSKGIIKKQSRRSKKSSNRRGFV